MISCNIKPTFWWSRIWSIVPVTRNPDRESTSLRFAWSAALRANIPVRPAPVVETVNQTYYTNPRTITWPKIDITFPSPPKVMIRSLWKWKKRVVIGRTNGVSPVLPPWSLLLQEFSFQCKRHYRGKKRKFPPQLTVECSGLLEGWDMSQQISRAQLLRSVHWTKNFWKKILTETTTFHFFRRISPLLTKTFSSSWPSLWARHQEGFNEKLFIHSSTTMFVLFLIIVLNSCVVNVDQNLQPRTWFSKKNKQGKMFVNIYITFVGLPGLQLLPP